MANFPYKHRFLLLSSKPNDPLDAAADDILQQCTSGTGITNVPVFGDVCIAAMPIAGSINFEFHGGTYFMHSAVIVAVGQLDPIHKADKLFRKGADLLVCEIQHYSVPDETETIVYLNKDMPNTSGIQVVKDRILKEKLMTRTVDYQARAVPRFCEIDFPIHASLHLQRMLGIDPRV